MSYEDLIKIGLNGSGPIKIIMEGSIKVTQGKKIGVVSVVFATTSIESAEKRFNQLISSLDNARNYYMIYSLPLDTDLTNLTHYPSIAVSKDEFE